MLSRRLNKVAVHPQDGSDEDSVPSSSRRTTLKSTVQGFMSRERYKPPKEHYPELTGGLLKFITEHRELLERCEPTCLVELENLVAKMLVPLPEETSLQTILETFGWDGSNFDEKLFTVQSINSLVQALGKLFSTQIFDGIRGTIGATGIDAMVSCETLFKDDKMMTSFGPDLLFALLNDNSTKGGPESLRTNVSISFKGACMLADISGFTKLSSQFCEKGSEGLDALHHAASVYLGKFVQVVYLYKGDVVAFAGDALICVFKTGADGDLASCCKMATQCALALKEMHTDDLSAHVAVSCGDMSFCSLGGLGNQWTYLLNGDCIAALSHCIDSALAREVVVTAGVFEQVSSNTEDMIFCHETIPKTQSAEIRYRITSVNNKIASPLDFSSRFTYLHCTKSTMNHFKCFIPRPIADAIKYGSLDTISELREVTTLFLKLDSYCAVANRDPLTLQGFFYMAQEALLTAGGFLRQFLIDDKGCVLIAMWGVPSYSYVDGRNRAVSCAIQLLSGATKLGHSCSAGISTGNIFCGNMGSFARRDFVGIGSTVNLAARLMGKADGKIFMDEPTHKGIPAEFKSLTTKGAGIVLKGFSSIYYPYVCDGSVALPVLSGGEKSEFVQEHVSKAVIDQVNLANRKKREPSTIIQTGLSKSVQRDQDTSRSDIQLRQLGMMDGRSQSIEKGEIFCPHRSVVKMQATSKTLMEDGSPMKTTNSEAQTIVLYGDAGSGKSAVAQLFRNYSTKCQFAAVGVRATDSDKTTPHSVMRKLFIELVGGASVFKTEEQQRTILTNLVDAASFDEVVIVSPLSLLCYVLDLSWNSMPETTDGSISSRSASQKVAADAKLMQLALHKVLRVLFAQQRRAVSVEDAHYCDESSWYGLYLLLSIPRNFPLLITLLSERTKALDLSAHSSKFAKVNDPIIDHLRANKSLAAIKANPSTKIVHISPLTSKEVNELICTRNGVDHIDPEVVKVAMEVSSGSLFWCREIANFIFKQGESAFLHAVNGNAGSPGKAINPLSILVTCRLEKLSAESQVVLKLASIVGVEFNLRLLSAVLPFKLISSVDESLADLVNHHFIQQDGSDLDSFYFGNALIRSLVYDLTPKRDLTRLHAHVAKKIESMHSPYLRPYYETLSYHFNRCGPAGAQSAFKYSVKAADYAIRRGTYDNGLSFATLAQHTATTRSEVTLLLSVVDRAMTDISTKLTDSENMFCVMTPQKGDESSTGFKDLRNKLEDMIICLNTFQNYSTAIPKPKPTEEDGESVKYSGPDSPFRAFSVRLIASEAVSTIQRGSLRPSLPPTIEHPDDSQGSRPPSPRLSWEASYTQNMLNDEKLVAVISDGESCQKCLNSCVLS